LGLEYDTCGGCIEEHFSCFWADNGEGEGRGDVFELDVGVFGVTVWRWGWAREDAGRDLIDVVGGILDLDVDAVICVSSAIVQVWGMR